MGNDLRFLRQLNAVNMTRLSNLAITMIGAGSIGSTTAVWLGKMGVAHLRVFDDDIVEAHNWSNQLYRAEDIGRPKVEALADVAFQLADLQIEAISERYTSQTLTEVVISGVDSMRSRAAIWKSVRDSPNVQLYIDTRMGLETLVVYAVRPSIRAERLLYNESIYSDNEALQEPCTARTICYTPLMAAAVICNLIKRYACGQSLPRQVILDLATFTILTQEL